MSPKDYKLGSVVVIDLPPAHGGPTALTVVLSRSCNDCALAGLCHRTDFEHILCSAAQRADGHDVSFKRAEA